MLDELAVGQEVVSDELGSERVSWAKTDFCKLSGADWR